ncbi:MAG: hypothetical protein M1134_04200 [Actinobacteria bacterium]|nr:hypothetical protein [Actinomycetota bacterium]
MDSGPVDGEGASLERLAGPVKETSARPALLPGPGVISEDLGQLVGKLACARI